jgi:fatty acid desaturase
MDKNKILTTVNFLLVVLGIAMIYIGGFYGPKVILPSIITGIGFFLIAWAIHVLKTNSKLQ